jgi:hypothetical protein
MFAFGRIAFPSTESLARQYVTAVINRDSNAGVELADPNLFELSPELSNIPEISKLTEALQFCSPKTLEDSVQQDIARFGGAEIRNLTIEVLNGTGSDDELQVAHVVFGFRRPDESEWRRGEMRLITDYNPPGPGIHRRYLCTNTLSYGP